MEVIGIAEADTLDSEFRITAESIDTDVDSFPPKSSSSEEIEVSECNKVKILKSDSLVVGEALDDGVELSEKEVLSPLRKNCNGVELGNGGELCPLISSPNSEDVEISSASDQTEDLEILSHCETPTESIFNPFAPGPEELALAPKKKILRKIQMADCRQLKFDICCDSEEKVDPAISNEEGCTLDSICESLPELSVSTQVNDVEDSISNGFMTPTSEPLLTGVADTCPDAPMRPAAKLRRLDQSGSRKLDFGGCLI